MKNIILLYQQLLHLEDAAFTRIEHEDAMVADVYLITNQDGTQLILKICKQSKDFLHEQYFLNFFADTLPVPKIIQIVQPQKDIPGAVLMECFPGAPLKIANFTNELAYEAGSLLAKIHCNRTTGYGDLTEPDSLSQNPRSYFTFKFEEGFAECGNHLPQESLDKCRDYYDNHVHLLDSVDGPCITHRDYRPGNIMAHEGKLQGIIDWSSARASFAQEDFCAMEHGVWPINPSTKKSFLGGYASIRPIPEYREIMPLLHLNKAIATIGFTVKINTWNNRDSKLYQYNRKFLENLFRNQT